MAKGNLFQGMGRGKVGDVVFSRLNGEQLSRVRNRNPKNPNTNKQLYQRAVMATVMQAYSAGIVIFDHAFQGKEVGAANQRRFISLNAKLLRSQIAADIKGGVTIEDQQGRVVAPGVSSPVAAALQVSEGTLRDVLFSSTVPEPLTDETVGAYCSRIGLVAGDLFTFVAFKNDSTSEVLFSVNGIDSDLAKQFKTQFLFARYAVKESAINDTTTTFANLAQILELTDSNFTPLEDFSTYDGGEETPSMESMCGQYTYGSCGWIRSRRNSDLRSKCIMSLSGASTGIASQYALKAWTQGTDNLGDSDLILEGGGGVEPAPAPTEDVYYIDEWYTPDPGSAELSDKMVAYGNYGSQTNIILVADGNHSEQSTEGSWTVILKNNQDAEPRVYEEWYGGGDERTREQSLQACFGTDLNKVYLVELDTDNPVTWMNDVLTNAIIN